MNLWVRRGGVGMGGDGGWEGLGSGPSTNTAFDGFRRVCAALRAPCAHSSDPCRAGASPKADPLEEDVDTELQEYHLSG